MQTKAAKFGSTLTTMGFFRRKSKSKVAQSQPSYASPWAPLANHNVADSKQSYNSVANIVTDNNLNVANDGVINYSESNFKNGGESFHQNLDVNSVSPPSPSPSAVYNVITSACSNGIELGKDYKALNPSVQAQESVVVDTESIWSDGSVHGFDAKFPKEEGASAAAGQTQEPAPARVSSDLQHVPRQALDPMQKGKDQSSCSWEEYPQVNGLDRTNQQSPSTQAKAKAKAKGGVQRHLSSSQRLKSPDPPVSHEKRASKSYALRTAMFREIVRHRGKSIDRTSAESGESKQVSQANDVSAIPIVATPIETAPIETTPIETSTRSESVTEHFDEVPKVASIISASSKSRIRATHLEADDSASLVSESKSFNSRDGPPQDETSTCSSTGSMPFSADKVSYQEDTGSVHGSSSCWSCGSPFESNDDEEDGTTSKNETATYTTTYETATCITADETSAHITTKKTTTFANVGGVKNMAKRDRSAPPAVKGDSHGRCIDEKSCADDDEDTVDDDLGTHMESLDGSMSDSFGSFDESLDESVDERSLNESLDGSLEDGVSYYDDDVSVGTRSINSTAKAAKGGSGWAIWFGFGGSRDEDTASQSGDTGARSRQSTIVSDETMEETVDDDETLPEGGSVVVSKGKNRREQTHEKPNIIPVDEAKKTVPDRKLSVASATRTGHASATTRQHTSDQEKVPQSKPVLAVPSLKKSWKKLKAPGSSGVKGGDVSIASEDTPATASVSKDSKNEKNVATPVSKENKKGKVTSKYSSNRHKDSRWNANNGQQHLFCVKNGGMANFAIKQYNAVPVPSAPSHVLIKVEVRFTHSSIPGLSTIPQF